MLRVDPQHVAARATEKRRRYAVVAGVADVAHFQDMGPRGCLSRLPPTVSGFRTGVRITKKATGEVA